MSKNNTVLLNDIKKTGKLKSASLEIFSILCKKPGLTAGEVFREYKNSNPSTNKSRNEIAKRINDLRNWGAIKGGEMTVCSETGRKAARWFVTGNTPDKTKTTKNASVYAKVHELLATTKPRNQGLAATGLPTVNPAATLALQASIMPAHHRLVLQSLALQCKKVASAPWWLIPKSLRTGAATLLTTLDWVLNNK